MICSGAVVLLLATSTLAGHGWPPDQSKANVNGKEAMAVFPAAADSAGRSPQPFAADDCVVQLAPEEALDQRFTYRCGEWFLPPGPGGYTIWVEMPDRVSSYQMFLRETETPPYRGRGFVQVQEVVPSGFVQVRQTILRGHTVRYLHLDRPGNGFSIRVPAEAASNAAPMPPGRVVAGIFNDATNEVVAYSRPRLVEAGKTTAFEINPPSKGGDLVVHLRKPPGQQKGGDTSFHVQTRAGLRPPDAVRELPSWYVLVWYELPAEEVTLGLSSSKFAMEPKKVTLREHQVTKIEGKLATGGAKP